MRKANRYIAKAAATLAALFTIATGIINIMSTFAAAPYHVSLSSSNFNLQILSASANDLSDPNHVTFSLQNGTDLWYSITTQSTPTGMVLTPANTGDPVTTTFFGATPLLPPANVLPFDQPMGSYSVETLHLAVAFSGPGQQVQIQLNPFDSHAVTLDVLNLLLRLLGEKNASVQIGLLQPGSLQNIFNTTGTMQNFQSLVNDYTSLLQNATNAASNTPDNTNTLDGSYACAKDLVALLVDQGEQSVLANLLWTTMGKAVTRESVLKAVTTIGQAQFGLGVEGFLRDQSLVLGSSLFQGNNPTVLIQTIGLSGTPTATSTTTPTPATSATPTSTPTTTPTATPTISPTSVPMTPQQVTPVQPTTQPRQPTPRPTPRPRPTPTPTPKPKPTPTPTPKPTPHATLPATKE